MSTQEVMPDSTVDPAVDEAIAQTASSAQGWTRRSWTHPGRIAFRISFLYFVCFLAFFGNGTIFNIFPVVGDWVYNASCGRRSMRRSGWDSTFSI